MGDMSSSCLNALCTSSAGYDSKQPKCGGEQRALGEKVQGTAPKEAYSVAGLLKGGLATERMDPTT